MTGECIAKQFYWRSTRLRNTIERLRDDKKTNALVVDRTELRDFLREIGVVEGALVMAHTSVTNLRLSNSSAGETPGGFMATADRLLNDLLGLLGPAGTLVMPSNPAYQTEDALRPDAERDVEIAYDPLRTPCAVGLTNELFRRRRGTLRSLHPYNPLAASGPLAEKLLENNLNDSEPLPHGIHSGFYRLCQRNGLIIGIGVTLRKYMTLVHVGEDVRDAEWPIKDFFERRRYRIHINGQDELHVVRQRRPKFGMFCTIRRCFFDMAEEGIIHHGALHGLTVDWASAREVYDFMMEKNLHSHYPYDGVKLMRWCAI